MLGSAVGQPECVLKRIVSGFGLLGINFRPVVVRPKSQGHAPPGHRQFGIEFRGTLEGPGGHLVSKGVQENQPLVEEALRLPVRRGDRVMVRAQAFHQEDRFLCGRFGVRVATRAQCGK